MSTVESAFLPLVAGMRTIDASIARGRVGYVYGTANTADAVADDGYIYLEILTPAATKTITVTNIVAKIQNVTASSGTLMIYEAPTFTTGETALTPRNYNRKVGDVSTVVVKSNPTGISLGTGKIIFIDKCFGNRGAESSTAFPATLLPATTYIAALQNVSGNAADMLLRVVFEEVDT